MPPTTSSGHTSRNVLKIHPEDNVMVALTDLRSGEIVDCGGMAVVLTSDVQAKHKFATRNLAVDDRIVMYGVVVGTAVKPIAPGETNTVLNTRHEAMKAGSVAVS